MPTLRPADENDHEYRLVCKGLTEAEFLALYRAIKDEEFAGKLSLRNPFFPSFDARTVHEIIITLSPAAAYVGKKVVDTLAAAIESKLKHTERRAVLTIYGPDGSVAREIITPKKRKQKI